MKKEIKELWLEALRSGKYKQGKQSLRENDKYCCLGVLCDLHGQDWRKSNGFYYYEECVASLPISVIKWSGMISSMGYLPDDEEYNSLADANDEGVSFEEIAELIEKHF